MGDSRVLAIDIETYGIIKGNTQNYFHPARIRHQDAPPEVIVSVAITLVDIEQPLCLSSLCDMTPGDSIVFDFSKPQHIRLLQQWLRHADTLLLMNAPFDLTVLRDDPRFSDILNGRHTILDAAIVNYLNNEFQPERSLKDIGLALRIYSYDDDIISHEKQYTSPSDPELHSYNSQDTHNTVLAIRELARRIRSFYPSTSKLSPYSISFFSSTIYSVIKMLEAGIPHSTPTLLSIQQAHQHEADEIAATLQSHNLLLTGTGSQKSQSDFINKCFDAAEEIDPLPQRRLYPDGTTQIVPVSEPARRLGVYSILDSELVEKTKAKRALSASLRNRILLACLLPPEHPTLLPLSLWNRHSHLMKRISSYTAPLLRRSLSKSNKRPHRSVLIPHPTLRPVPSDGERAFVPTRPHILYDSSVAIAYPSIFITPSKIKDDDGASGGQRQGRLSFKDPGAATYPSDIKATLRSRYHHGSIISFDLSQAELRVAALLSGEETLLRAFTEGLDLHSERAVSVFRSELLRRYPAHYLDEWIHDDHSTHADAYEEFSDDFRQPAKHANFTDLNLGGADVLQATILKKSRMLIPIEVCRKIVAMRPKSRPRLTAWQTELIAKAKSQGYIEMPFTGHSHLFLGGSDNKPNEIVNHPIQVGAATAMLDIQNHLDLPPLILPFLNIYDAVLLDTPPRLLSDAYSAFETSFNRCVTSGYWAMLCDHAKHTCPLRYDAKVISCSAEAAVA